MAMTYAVNCSGETGCLSCPLFPLCFTPGVHHGLPSQNCTGSRRDPEEGGGAGLRKLDFFCFGLFLNSNATDIVLVTLPSTAVETAIAQCTSRCAMARRHRLNISIVLAAVHGLSGLFWAVSAVKPSLSRPLPPPPPSPSLISNLTSVDVKQHGHVHDDERNDFR